MFELAVPHVRPDCEAARARDPRWALWSAILGSSMVFIDGTVVNVALPVIQRELDAPVTTMQWVVEAFALTLASLVLVGGALGDRYGRKRVFALGVALFSLASLACGLAPSSFTLVLARAIQGIGGALLVPGSLALISAAYDDEEQRGRAIGVWSAASAVTSAVGPVAGGWLIAHGSWRWLFLLNLPVAPAILLLVFMGVQESRDQTLAERMDWLGTALAVIGLGLLVYGLLEAPNVGGLGTLGAGMPTLVGVFVLVAFVYAEARARAPMVPLELFRSHTFAGANLLTLLLYAALGGCLFFLPFDLIQVQHYTPAEAGAALPPMVLGLALLSRWAGGMVARYGARLPLVIGPLIAAVGFALLAMPGLGSRYVVGFLPGILTLGIGMGITVAPLTTAVMGAVDARHAGLASGINNAVARTASLLAVAALGLVMVVRFNAELDAALRPLHLSGAISHAVDAQRANLADADLGFADPKLRAALQHAFDTAFIAGFRALTLVCAGLAAASAAAAAWLIEPGIRAR